MRIAGIQLSGVLTKAPKKVRNFLGFCLFPQAGVAIGLALFVRNSPEALTASAEVKSMLHMVVNIILLTVFINEMVGPIFSKFGIKKGTSV